MYICEQCIEENRLEPILNAPATMDGVCECCWKRRFIIWVDAVAKRGSRVNGVDPEWMTMVKERPEGETMDSATERFMAMNGIRR